MRKITVVTGTRAEYGILNPVLKAVETRQEMELSLIATGMHLSHDFGYTVRDIEKDGFRIDATVDMLLSSDKSGAMAKSIGLGIIGMAQAYEQLRPDIILVLGDRVEPLAAVIAGAYMNIPVAHIHGGDICGNIDDSVRHAITKLSHIHFPATKKSADRIIRMGEEEWRVHAVGSPSLDVLLNEPVLSVDVLMKELEIDLAKPLILVIQHPVTTQMNEAPTQMRETLEAIVEMGYDTVVIYPNSDAGGRSMIDVIREFEEYHFIKIMKSLARKKYLGLMKAASVMIGNSSSGLIDAPSFGLPVVNIGIRQGGRERGNNVIDVGHDRIEIMRAVEKALSDEEFLTKVKVCDNPYGDGKTGARIAEILSGLEITPKLLCKEMVY